MSSTAAGIITVRAVARSTEIHPHEASGRATTPPWRRTGSPSPTGGSAWASRRTPDAGERREEMATHPAIVLTCDGYQAAAKRAEWPRRELVLRGDAVALFRWWGRNWWRVAAVLAEGGVILFGLAADAMS